MKVYIHAETLRGMTVLSEHRENVPVTGDIIIGRDQQMYKVMRRTWITDHDANLLVRPVS